MADTNVDVEELKKKLFISELDEQKFLEKWVEQYAAYGRCTADGRVVITSDNLITKNKIGLVIALRYLANKLVASIEPTVTVEFITKTVGVSAKLASARLSDLTSDGYVQSKGRGVYEFLGYKLDDFLKVLKGE